MRLVLARHGDVIDPAGDNTHLTSLGVQQSENMGDGLIGFNGDIYTSPLARTAQTAKIIGQKLGIKPQVANALSEVSDRETILQAQTRALDFLDSVKGLGQDMIFVTHGGIILGIAICFGHPDGVCDRGQFLEVEI